MAGKTKLKKVPGLRVTAKVDTFRRAGFTFTKEPRVLTSAELEAAKFTEEQYKALKAEPMLVVEEGEFDVEDTAGEATE